MNRPGHDFREVPEPGLIASHVTEAVRDVLATAFPGAEIQVQDLGRAAGVAFDLALPSLRPRASSR